MAPDADGRFPSLEAEALRAHLALWTLRRAGFLPRRRITLSLTYGGARFACVISDYTELSMIRDIFLDESCARPGLREPRVIFDLGSNIGLSILFFRIRYPNARIFGFEPDPNAFAKLIQNVGGLSGVEVRNVAIAPRDERRSFHISPHSWASSLVPNAARSTTRSVMARSLRSLIAELEVSRVDLVKMDIEGASGSCFGRSAPVTSGMSMRCSPSST